MASQKFLGEFTQYFKKFGVLPWAQLEKGEVMYFDCCLCCPITETHWHDSVHTPLMIFSGSHIHALQADKSPLN